MAVRTVEAPRWRALAALVFGACVIGFSAVLVRLTETGPVAAGFWRLAFALPALALIARRSTGTLGRPSGIALVIGLMFAGDLAFWHEGIKYTSVANATVLSNLTPVVVTAFAWIFLKQRPRALFLLAVAVALAGVWMMAVGRSGGGHLLNEPLGNLFSISTALWYALYFLAMSEGRKREGASRLMFWSGMVGAPILLAAALLLREQIAPPTAAGWAACAGARGGAHRRPGLDRLGSRPPAHRHRLGGRAGAAGGGRLAGLDPVRRGARGRSRRRAMAVVLGGVVLAQWVSRPKAPTSGLAAA